MKLSRLSIAALLAMVAMSASALAADETYTVRLHRAEKAGDLYDTHIALDQTQTTTVSPAEGAPQVEKEVTKGDLTG
ncbi:MAG TPA: hypothetical protein VHM90_07440, partial [Phycisphaerae bacterium]|nr:hypothetical protein [Phycisphaerae bacterium]